MAKTFLLLLSIIIVDVVFASSIKGMEKIDGEPCVPSVNFGLNLVIVQKFDDHHYQVNSADVGNDRVGILETTKTVFDKIGPVGLGVRRVGIINGKLRNGFDKITTVYRECGTITHVDMHFEVNEYDNSPGNASKASPKKAVKVHDLNSCTDACHDKFSEPSQKKAADWCYGDCEKKYKE